MATNRRTLELKVRPASALRSPRVLLADHHLVFLEGLHVLMEARGLEVVGRATNGADAVRLAREQRPEVVVLEVMLPLLNGVDAAREIAGALPGTGIILLSDWAEDRLVRDALRAGVRGFVVKTQDADALVQAIREVSRGGMYVSPGPAQAVVDACLNGHRADSLSPRQRQVLRLVAEGNSTKEVAALLRISVRTVDAHRASIMRTLQIHDTPGLVRYAIRHGMIQP